VATIKKQKAVEKIQNHLPDPCRSQMHVEFVLELLRQKGVLTVHGSGFGEQYGSGHFRIVYLPKMEIVESAMNKSEDFVR
jgi:aspartate/methionine/tyrosine aminotransferase